MTSAKRGLFIIINNDHFLPETKLHRLVGAHHDVANLRKVFNKLGFEIQPHLNLTADEILHILTEGTHTHSCMDRTALGELRALPRILS